MLNSVNMMSYSDKFSHLASDLNSWDEKPLGLDILSFLYTDEFIYKYFVEDFMSRNHKEY